MNLMAKLVKWLTRRIVAPVCKGSIPLFRPRMEKKSKDFKIEIDSYESIFFVVRKELVINIKIKISDIYDESVVPIKDFM